jgi:hypothetical protein
LDDTARWLGFTARLFTAGPSTAGLAPSSYKVMLDSYLVAGAYPAGGFMLLGVGRGLLHVDAAWVFQPYLACAGAALAMCLYSLADAVIPSARLRGVVAFVAAQPALLYGYGLWGGIKEMTAAFLLALIAALAAIAIRERPASPRRMVPLGVATAALIVTNADVPDPRAEFARPRPARDAGPRSCDQPLRQVRRLDRGRREHISQSRDLWSRCIDRPYAQACSC